VQLKTGSPAKEAGGGLLPTRPLISIAVWLPGLSVSPVSLSFL
jgi:hypothetical protein